MPHRSAVKVADEDDDNKWKIDHKIQLVPMLGLAIVLIGYAIVGVQQVSKIESRLIAVESRNLEQDISAQQKLEQQNKNFEKLWAERDASRDRLARLEERMINLLDIMQRVDRRLEGIQTQRRIDGDLPLDLKR